MARHTLAALVLLLLFLGGGSGPATSRAAGPVTVTVTDSTDNPGFCPSSGHCTLRAAIDFVNAETTPGTVFLIRFSASTFSAGGTTIAIANTPLPAISADDVTVDPMGLPIRLSGASLTEAAADGLTLAGERNAVRGLAIEDFPGSCLVLAGPFGRAGGLGVGEGVQAGGCVEGVKVTGENSQVVGSLIGFAAGGQASPVDTGVLVSASGSMIGPATGNGAGLNFIGNASAGIRVAGTAQAIQGIVVRANRIGAGPGGEAAPVGSGVVVDDLSTGATIQDNQLANSAFAGVSIGANKGAASVSGIVVSGDSFLGTGGMPVDLGGNGLSEPNDPEDDDVGPNGLQNHPIIARATGGGVFGVVPACGGCTVEIYVADHEAGALMDRDLTPIPGLTGLTASDGTFALAGQGLEVGSWIAGIATGPEGSSEFGPSARVGTGSGQCAPTFLTAGWNHAPYLGQPVSLGMAFPSSGDVGAVTAIYELVDGAGTYKRWFPGGGPGRTLHELVPGATYWFFAARPLELAGGFTFSSPIPIVLQPGWNDFVYLGAPGDVRDVFRDLAGEHDGPYHFEPGNPGRWTWGGASETPPWAADFTDLAPCSTYHVHFNGVGTLIPLQP